MPVTIHSSALKVKDMSTGQYVGVDGVSESTAAEKVAQINAAGAAKVAEVNAAGTENVGNVNNAGTTNLAAINTRAQEVEASLPKSGEMEDMVAEVFVKSKAYPAGQLLIQAVNNVNKLYRLKGPHTAGDDWDASNATEIKLGNEVSSLKSAIDELEETQLNLLFEKSSVSGTREAFFPLVLSAGNYTLSVGNLVSSDTDPTATTSNIRFIKDNTMALSVPILRGQASTQEITIPSDVNKIYFYGKNQYSDSAGITFTFTDVKLTQNTGLNERLTSIETSLSNVVLDVEEVKEKTDNTIEILYNYFNPNDAVSGYYYDGNVGETISSEDNSAMAGIIFPVVKGKTYVLAQTNYRWNELDSNNVILARNGNSTKATQLPITPNTNGVKKVAISWVKADVPIEKYMILDPGVSFVNYISYPSVTRIKNDVLNASGIENEQVYTVGTGGDFSTFTEMLIALKDNKNKKTVFVMNGVYDIFTEIGGKSYIESLVVADGWRAANYIVPENTHIIGIGNVVLQFTPSDENIIDFDHGWLMSPLNISGSCTIENITVIGSNCRYAIHMESDGGTDDGNTANILLKNVRVNREQTTLMGSHSVIGAGIGYNAKWEFDSCKMIGPGNTPIFGVHTNAPNVQSSASIIMRNCIIDTDNGTPVSSVLLNFISQYLPVAITNYAYVENCYVGGKIGTTTRVTFRQSYDISVIGGTSKGIEDSADQTSGYTINTYGHNVV